MSIPKDLPKSIGEQTDKTPNLDFLDKVDGPVSTQAETEEAETKVSVPKRLAELRVLTQASESSASLIVTNIGVHSELFMLCLYT